MNKLEILVPKISDNKTESFWYYDEQIAEIITASGRKFIAETAGEMQGRLEEDGTVFRGHDLLIEAINLELDDLAIQECMINDMFRYNNWFVVREVLPDGNVDDDLDIQGDYDSIINSLKDISKEF